MVVCIVKLPRRCLRLCERARQMWAAACAAADMCLNSHPGVHDASARRCAHAYIALCDCAHPTHAAYRARPPARAIRESSEAPRRSVPRIPLKQTNRHVPARATPPRDDTVGRRLQPYETECRPACESPMAASGPGLRRPHRDVGATTWHRASCRQSASYISCNSLKSGSHPGWGLLPTRVWGPIRWFVPELRGDPTTLGQTTPALRIRTGSRQGFPLGAKDCGFST